MAIFNFMETVTSVGSKNPKVELFKETPYTNEYDLIDLYHEGLLNAESVEAMVYSTAANVQHFVKENKGGLSDIDLIAEATTGEQGFFTKVWETACSYWNAAVEFVKGLLGKIFKLTGTLLDNAKKGSIALVEKVKTSGEPNPVDTDKYTFLDTAKWTPVEAIDLGIKTLWSADALTSITLGASGDNLNVKTILEESIPELIKDLQANTSTPDSDAVVKVKAAYDAIADYRGLENKDDKAKYYVDIVLAKVTAAPYNTVSLKTDAYKGKNITEAFVEAILPATEKTYTGAAECKALFKSILDTATNFSTSTSFEDAKKVVSESGKVLKDIADKYKAIPKGVKSAGSEAVKSEDADKASENAKTMTELVSIVAQISSFITSNIMTAYRLGDIAVNKSADSINAAISIGNKMLDSKVALATTK